MLRSFLLFLVVALALIHAINCLPNNQQIHRNNPISSIGSFYNQLLSQSSPSAASEQQSCSIEIPPSLLQNQTGFIIDVHNAASPTGYYRVPEVLGTELPFYAVQICDHVRNLTLCSSDTDLSVAFHIDSSLSCKRLSSSSGPTTTLLQNSTHPLGISLSYSPFGVNNFFTGAVIDIYCSLYVNSENVTGDGLVFRKKITTLLTTTYYFEMYTPYACPTNGTVTSKNSTDLKEFYQMFLAISVSTVLVVGLCHFVVSLFSYRVFSLNFKTIWIPLISFLIGCAYCLLQVVIYALIICGIYVSVGVSMSPVEVAVYIIIASLPLLFNASGILARTRLEFF